MRDSTNFWGAFERVAIYLAEIVLSSVLGYTYGVISGASGCRTSGFSNRRNPRCAPYPVVCGEVSNPVQPLIEARI